MATGPRLGVQGREFWGSSLGHGRSASLERGSKVRVGLWATCTYCHQFIKVPVASVDNNGMGGRMTTATSSRVSSQGDRGRRPIRSQDQRSFAFRLRLALVMVLMPCLAVGVVAWLNLHRSVEQAARVSKQVVAEGEVVVDLQGNLRRVEAFVDRAGSHDQALRQEMIAIMAAVHLGFAEATTFDDAAERDIAIRAEQEWLVVRANLALWLLEPAGEPLPSRLDGLDQPITAAIRLLYALDASTHEDLHVALEANTDRARRDQSALVVALATAVLLTAWTARRLRLAAYRPLEQLESGLQRLRTDGLQHHVEITGDREFHAVADALNEMSDRIARQISDLEALDRLKTEFVATTSHELRTPLTNVLGQLELLADGDYGELGADQTRSVAIMDRNGRRLLRLIEDILTLTRMEATGMELRPVATDLHALMGGIEAMVQPAAASGAVELRFDVCAALGALDVDAAQLERALTNLVSNAIKFTPPGGAVTLRAEQTPHHVIFTIWDTGIGIPLAEQDRLFTRFFRSSLATDLAIQGSGLGLVIAKAIIEEHGGTLSLVSVEGEGTVVTTMLPLPPTSTDGQPHDRDPKGVAATASPTPAAVLATRGGPSELAWWREHRDLI